MEKKETILNERLGIANGIEQKVALPFSAPDSYFNNLSSTIISRLAREEFLSAEKREPNYTLPNGYFENFPDGIVEFVKTHATTSEIEEELSVVASILNRIAKETPYQVPKGYFDSIVIDTTEHFPKLINVGKVVSITKYLKWIKIGVAASLIGFITISAFILFNNNNKSGLALVSNKPIDIKSGIDKIPDEDLVKYLNTDYQSINTDNVILDDGEVPDIEQKVESIPDEDLNEYLQDAATNIPNKKAI